MREKEGTAERKKRAKKRRQDHKGRTRNSREEIQEKEVETGA
jgi:hypothetical protein